MEWILCYLCFLLFEVLDGILPQDCATPMQNGSGAWGLLSFAIEVFAPENWKLLWLLSL